jgi:hypothetical protein
VSLGRVAVEGARSRPAAAIARPRAPWRGVAAEAEARELEPGQRLLLGVSLVLRRAPALARSRGFADAVDRWWRGAVAVHDGQRDATRSPPGVAPGTSGAPASPGERGDGHGLALRGLLEVPAVPAGRARSAARPTRIIGPVAGESDAAPAGVAATQVRSKVNLAASTPGAPQVVTFTELAGLFYLLNVGLYLGLYGDFTTPLEPGLRLDPWDFVTLVGRSLLGELDEHDDVWELLATLAGRAGENRTVTPGRGFRAPLVWRISEDWLRPFAGARRPWLWTASAERLRVVHPAGFVAIDVAVGDDRRTQLARELERYGGPRVAERVVASRIADPLARPGLDRWVRWVSSYVAARLRVAVGARSNGAACRLVLRCPGRILVTPGRVEVVMALERLPVAVRRAGLDRTPGWIPAAGRHVGFNFDCRGETASNA